MEQQSLKQVQLAFMERQQKATARNKTQHRKPKGPSKPMMRQIKDILEALDPHKPSTFEDIEERTDIDLTDESNKQLLEELKLNPLVLFKEPNLFYYKPRYNLRDKDELLALILRSPDGIQVEHLQDAYQGVLNDINSLVANHQIIKIYDTQNKYDVVYADDIRFHNLVKVDVEFQQMWGAIRIPDDIDLEKEMAKAGLKMMEQEQRSFKRPAPKKKERKNKGKVRKVTNVHMLQQEIVQQQWKQHK